MSLQKKKKKGTSNELLLWSQQQWYAYELRDFSSPYMLQIKKISKP